MMKNGGLVRIKPMSALMPLPISRLLPNGDVRSALNALELAVISTETDESGTIHIDLQIAEECMQKKASHMTRTEMPIMMFCRLSKNQFAEVM